LNENQTWFVGGAFILTTIVPFSNVQWILNNSGTYWATPYQTPSATPPIDQSLASLECPEDVSVELQSTVFKHTTERPSFTISSLSGFPVNSIEKKILLNFPYTSWKSFSF
jgi:hypothetical protein